MPKQAKKEMRPRQSDSVPGAMLTGAVCLAVGLLIGYYFGKLSGRAAAPAAERAGTVQNPASFIQTEAVLKSTLAANPKDLQTLIRLGNLYYDNSRFQDAADYYGGALEVDPRDVNVRTDRGTCFWSLGQADPAIREFQMSLEIDPTHAQTLFNLGVVLLNGKNDADQARAAWQKLLEANPNYPDRRKVQEMLASLSTPPPAPQGKSGTQSLEELMERMKKR